MSEFYVNTDKWKTVISNLDGVNKTLSSSEKSISGIRSNLRVPEVGASLDALLAQLSTEKTNTDSLKDLFEQIKEKYVNTENAIVGAAPTLENTSGESGDANNSTNTSQDDPWWKNLGTDSIKTLLDILGSFGGGATIIGGIPIALVKALLDGDFTTKDWGALIKAGGKSITSLIDNYNKMDDLKKLWGLKQFSTLTKDATASWFANAGKTFKNTFMDKFGLRSIDPETGASPIKGTKIAGWALALIANGFSNAEEYQKANGSMSTGRAVAETVSETIIDMGKGALLAAGIAAGCAAAGVAAPAVVVTGGAVAASIAIDYIGKAITGDKSFSVTEALSDTILDAGTFAIDEGKKFLSDVGKKASGAAEKAKNAICSWGKKVSFQPVW